MNTEDRELLIEIKTILLGKEGTPEGGMAAAVDKIEKHLEKINGTNAEQEVKIERNRDRIATQWKMGGGILAIIGVIVAGLVLNALGVIPIIIR